MGSRFAGLFLMVLAAAPAWAEEDGGVLLLDGAATDEERAPLVDPDLAQREVQVTDIDTENLEIGVYGGLLSIEDFGSSAVTGVQVGWHFTEDLFIQANGYMSRGGTTSYETLSGGLQLLTDDERDYVAWDLSLGFNVFPGEAFVGRKRAFNTAFYLTAGIGSTEFAGDDRYTLTVGAGYRLLATDWLAWHVGWRDHLFAIDTLGTEKDTHNVELYSGLTTFF